MRWHLLGLLMITLLGACSAPVSLTHHKLSYEVSAEHENDSIRKFLEQQPLSFSIHFSNDSFYAHYEYGNTQLHHLAPGRDTAILAAGFDANGYKSYLDAAQIDQYLQLRMPYRIEKQSGKTAIDTIQCHRALIIYPDGNSTELYFAKKWRPANPNYDYGFREIKGLPVKFSVIEEDITYHFRLDEMERSEETISPPSFDQYQLVDVELLLNNGLTW